MTALTVELARTDTQQTFWRHGEGLPCQSGTYPLNCSASELIRTRLIYKSWRLARTSLRQVPVKSRNHHATKRLIEPGAGHKLPDYCVFYYADFKLFKCAEGGQVCF